MEKLLDEVIDAGMAQGKTDEQILAELGAMTGMLRSEDALTNEEVAEREQKLNQELEESVTPEERRRALESIAGATFTGQDQFEDLTRRHSTMLSEADAIVSEWDSRREEVEEWKESG